MAAKRGGISDHVQANAFDLALWVKAKNATIYIRLKH